MPSVQENEIYDRLELRRKEDEAWRLRHRADRPELYTHPELSIPREGIDAARRRELSTDIRLLLGQKAKLLFGIGELERRLIVAGRKAAKTPTEYRGLHAP